MGFSPPNGIYGVDNVGRAQESDREDPNKIPENNNENNNDIVNSLV